MITEQKLKEQCTPEFIKWMCEHAEGFKFIQCEDNYFSISVNNQEYGNIITDEIIFPLLIHRAVEGWNKKAFGKDCIVISDDNLVFWSDNLDLCRVYDFKNYQPESLTLAENAMLHCLLDIFSETGGER